MTGVIEGISKDYVSEEGKEEGREGRKEGRREGRKEGRKVVHMFVELIMKCDANEIGREDNWCGGLRT